MKSPPRDKRIESEEQLVQDYLAPLAAQEPGAFALRDDCALYRPVPGYDLVFKTDPVVAGVHFLPDDDAADIAWKALAVNVSDLAAKGATPVAYLMSLAFPEPPLQSWMFRFAAGLATAQDAFACRLIGGDTDRVPTAPLSIAITVFGTLPEGSMIQRGGARPGDRLFVSGTIGDATLGLRLRVSKNRGGSGDPWTLSASQIHELTDRYLRPSPRLALAPVLRAYASAAMDLSDGLAKDAARMCQASHANATLSIGAVPLSVSAAKLVDAGLVTRETLITAGDDYEILFAVAPENCADCNTAAQAAGIPIREIGVFTAGAGELTILGTNGERLTVDRPGWDHLA